MEELDNSIVHKNLESKLKILGLEALDLLIVLIFAAIMSLFFGSGTLGVIFVVFFPLTLLTTLYFIKRNKPDGYIQNLLKFYLSPGHYSAFYDPEHEESLTTTIIKHEE